MPFHEIPTELIEYILESCGLLDILHCKAVCRFLRDIVQDSPRLEYKIELGILGYNDEHVNPNCALETRQRMLKNARRMWSRPSKFVLVETLDLSHLVYGPLRLGYLLDMSRHCVEGPDQVFDVRVISHKPGPATERWQLRLPFQNFIALLTHPLQDLVVARAPGPIDGVGDAAAWFSFRFLSLRTGQPHYLATQPVLHVELSERFQDIPHYTRVKTYGSTLTVATASPSEGVFETVVFNWHTGRQLGRFSSPVDALLWGDANSLISPTCFLLTSYSKTEQTCYINVYAIDPGDSTPDHHSSSGISHVATYSMPRTHLQVEEYNVSLKPTCPRQVFSDNDLDGYLTSGNDGIMLLVSFTPTRHTRNAKFFTPVKPFLDAADSYLALPSSERPRFIPRNVSWREWGRNTRWVTGREPWWDQYIYSDQRGSGTRYAFAGYIIDFAPLELAKAVAAQRRLDPSVTRFSDGIADGYTIICDSPKAAMGSEFFTEEIHGSLPYREKKLPELGDMAPSLDWELVGDKLVSLEGFAGIVEIYQLDDDGLMDQ